MSHQPERKEKDCLNCGAEVQGRYCQRCGQENIVPHQNFLSLTQHFIYDIFHFDGKFFDTLKYLFLQPGRVPREYVQGKRTQYLDPIRMYLFTSAVFFLFFFSTQKLENAFNDDDNRYMTKIERFEASARLYAPNSNLDSLQARQMALLLDTAKSIRIQKVQAGKKVDSATLITIDSVTYTMHPTVDSFVFSDDEDMAETDWVEKNFDNKWIKHKRKYGDDVNKMMADFTGRFIHYFPYILFISLPFFALILKLLYIRRKQFFYSDHAVFTLYHYIFSFILMLLILVLQMLYDKVDWGIFKTTSSVLSVLWFVYLFLSLKKFYGQGLGVTFGKFVLLNILGFVSLLLIFLLFTFLLIFQL